jgi:hypothetical protein
MFALRKMNAVRLLIGGIALVTVFVFAEGASAGVIKIVPKGPYTASVANCVFEGVLVTKYTDCTSTAFISDTDATATTTFLKGAYNGTGPTDQTFMSTFGVWNKSQQTGVKWTIVNGGALADLTLTVNPFEACATEAACDRTKDQGDGGGIGAIRIVPTMETGYKGPPLNQLVWAQATYDNATGPDAQAVNTLDVYTKGCMALPAPPPNSKNVTVDIPGIAPKTQYCEPIYPDQYDNKRFFDAPSGPWPDFSFRAIALLATVSETTNAAGTVTAATLTVYDGVNYGFDLSAKAAMPAAMPEPSTWMMMFAGFAGLGFAGYRARKAGSIAV